MSDRGHDSDPIFEGCRNCASLPGEEENCEGPPQMTWSCELCGRTPACAQKVGLCREAQETSVGAPQ